MIWERTRVSVLPQLPFSWKHGSAFSTKAEPCYQIDNVGQLFLQNFSCNWIFTGTKALRDAVKTGVYLLLLNKFFIPSWRNIRQLCIMQPTSAVVTLISRTVDRGEVFNFFLPILFSNIHLCLFFFSSKRHGIQRLNQRSI